MSDETTSPASAERWASQYQERSRRLNALRVVQEPPSTSKVPIVGPLLAWLRSLWNRLATRWYVRPLLEQQNRFNQELVQAFDELAVAAVSLRLEVESAKASPAGAASPAQPFGYCGTPGEEHLADMAPAELLAWENAGVPSPGQYSVEREAHADELLDEETVQNYPLHWRTRAECWKYLFDLALSCEALGCNPGDRVLDYAAGTCWASEFLNRAGFRTVALDLSWEVLRQGRRRLAADERLKRRSAAGFVVGSALELPFADESFEGVLCLNALHHMPSYCQALREIYRILKPGGRAVFSEPGAAHAQHPISQTRMREFGVLEKSVSLPHIHRLAKEIGFTRMLVVPLRDAPYYFVEYTAAPEDLPALQRLWSDTLVCGPRERSRFVLEKGNARPVDSLMPPAVVLSRSLQAQISLLHHLEHVSPGTAFRERLQIANTGEVIWRAQGKGFGGQVSCGVKLCTPGGQVLRDDIRVPLPRDVAPGEDIVLEVPLQAPTKPGEYLLKYDLVIEWVAWLEQYGSQPAWHRLLVRP